MRFSRSFVWCVVPALLLAVSGCDKGGYSGLIPVTGKVTYNGTPVAGAAVSFVGGEATASGSTQDDGTYKLYTRNQEGAMPGKYAVTVVKTSVAAAPPAPPSASATPEEMKAYQERMAKPPEAPKSLIPEKYNSAKTSGIELEVKQGGSYDITLTD